MYMQGRCGGGPLENVPLKAKVIMSDYPFNGLTQRIRIILPASGMGVKYVFGGQIQ